MVGISETVFLQKEYWERDSCIDMRLKAEFWPFLQKPTGSNRNDSPNHLANPLKSLVTIPPHPQERPHSNLQKAYRGTPTRYSKTNP
jgi:hypothetical protein